MTRSLGPLIIALAMLASTSGLAQNQDEAGGTPSSDTSAPVTIEPNAPLQSTDQGPLPAGDEAGTTTASNWQIEPSNVAVGAAVLGAAVCIAVCNNGQSSTSTTTTTAPK